MFENVEKKSHKRHLRTDKTFESEMEFFDFFKLLSFID